MGRPRIIAAVLGNERLEVVREADAWDTFLEAQDGHLLQSWAWGELKSRYGWRSERVLWREGGTIHGAGQVLYRSLAPALALAYVPRGPVVERERLAEFLECLKRHTRARGVIFLRLEPDWERENDCDRTLRQTGFAGTPETIQPPTTIRIDLTADPDVILGRMKAKWRYNIRLAEKKNVVVRAGTEADFGAFYDLMQLTAERDKFAIHGAEYYRTAFQLLKRRDNVRLLIAEFETRPLAMIFVTAFAQEAIYLYGASGNEERNRMPNHALHWAAIQWAKAKGCRRYDLWGIPEGAEETSEEGNLPSSLYQFKQGFGGEVVRYTGAWDFVFNKPLYRVYQLARRLRQRGLA